MAEAKLSKLTITAPFSGIIGLRSVSVGDYVKEGTDMVNLESVDTLKVDFRVPEIYLTQVRVGQTLQMTLDAMPGKSYEGTVFAINPLIDAAGRSVVIRAQVRNQGTCCAQACSRGCACLTRELQDALVVPEQAIVPQGDEWYVYRVVDGKALRTKVDIGQRRDGKTEIVKRSAGRRCRRHRRAAEVARRRAGADAAGALAADGRGGDVTRGRAGKNGSDRASDAEVLTRFRRCCCPRSASSAPSSRRCCR